MHFPRSASTSCVPWTEIDPYRDRRADPPALDLGYHRVPTHFASWLGALADAGRLTMNPPQIARDNIDKIYLQTLEAAGIAIPRTRWLDRIDTTRSGGR
jgi:glutathione synthase/RimK-type ligase-like ATP-grasp enzyme